MDDHEVTLDSYAYISKLYIENFKTFGAEGFWMNLKKGVNIIVGDNESGKSTILEAVNLILSGYFQGKHIAQELSSDLFNKITTEEYLSTFSDPEKENSDAPSIVIELYFEGIQDDAAKALLEGDDNKTHCKACGVRLKIELGSAFHKLYEQYVSGGVLSLPIEYYECHWSTFARDDSIRPSSIPINSALIDSTASKYPNGSDIYISRIMKNILSDEDQIAVAQAHRHLKEKFRAEASIEKINELIKKLPNISEREVTLSVDMSSRSSWDGSMTTHVGDIPFQYIGKGEQTKIKTKLSLSDTKSDKASVILLEEPENHLSHHNLNSLIGYINETINNKQIIVTTHSSFVANKLGLDRLVLLSPNHATQILSELDDEGKAFFEKLPGFDTLRLVISKKSILVEGPSDELVVARAYRDLNNDHMPIDDGVEVISVGTSSLQFLKIAQQLKIPTFVVTDSDGDLEALEKKYESYLGENKKDNITISYDSDIDSENVKAFNLDTLEPKILKSNSLDSLNSVLEKECNTEEELRIHMRANKTEVALKIFQSGTKINYPQYILAAIADDNE